jgi:hypothetical protein
MRSISQTVTLGEISSGFVAYGAFKPVFADLVFPANAQFFCKSQDGVPVCSRVVDSAALAHHSTETVPGSFGHDDSAEVAKVVRDAEHKRAQRNMDLTQQYKGAWDEKMFVFCFGSLPIWEKAGPAVKTLLGQPIPHFPPTTVFVDKFLRFEYGSEDGVTAPGMASVTSFQRVESDRDKKAAFGSGFARMCLGYGNGMGSIASEALQLLYQTLQAAMEPTDALNHDHTLIGVAGAIDISNSTLYEIGHSPLLASRAGAERWFPAVRNVKSSQAWIDAVQLQQVANIQSLIRTSMHNNNADKRGSRGNPANTGNGGRGGKGGRGGNKGRDQKRQHSDAQPTGNKAQKRDKPDQTGAPGVECRHQAARDGCPYGLACRFKRSDEHPKTDDTKRQSTGRR